MAMPARMTPRPLALLAASLLVALPLVHAHTDGQAGPVKEYCEDVALDAWVHDYFGGEYGPMLVQGDGAIGPCPFDPTSDGHYEYALSGAAFVTDPVASSLCGWPTADHTTFPQVSVVDNILSPLGGVVFVVAADTSDSTGFMACGDHLVDVAMTCVDTCWVPFLPGLDGVYYVFVEDGTSGHVLEGVPPECLDRRDNDNDGTRDFGLAIGFLADSGCSSWDDATE